MKLMYESRIFLLIFLLSFLLSSFSIANTPLNDLASAGGLSKKFLEHEGISRSYNIYVPDNINKTLDSYSLVFLLHGHGGSTDQLIGITGKRSPYKLWLSIADREKLILVIPDGLYGSDNKQGWNDSRNTSTNPKSDDVGFLAKIISTISKSHTIDRNRVYVMGTSNGGHMALRLAAEASDTYAAVAAIAAANPKPHFKKVLQRPISVLLMNGTKDKIFPYYGGKMFGNRGAVQSTDASISFWVNHNSCDYKPMSYSFPDKKKRDRSKVLRKVYKNGKKNTEVALYKIKGGGHTEPSIVERYSLIFLALVGPQNGDIEMADEVWKFFENKRLHTKN